MGRRNDNYSDIKLYIIFHIEYKTIEFITNKKELTIGGTVIIDKLGDIIDRVSCECKETIVTGDFICDVSGDDSSTTSNPVISCFNLFQMLQLIHDPTRVSEFTNSTIDLMFTTSHTEVVSESGVLPVLISAHYLVYGVHCWKAPKKERRSIEVQVF